jgi:plasmid stabilization system protein ParE
VRRLSLSNEAVADLRGIIRHSDNAWGVKRIQYVGALRTAMLRLRERPYVGEVHPDTGEVVRRIRQGRHLIFYEAHETHIRILRVPHDQMDIERRLER